MSSGRGLVISTPSKDEQRIEEAVPVWSYLRLALGIGIIVLAAVMMFWLSSGDLDAMVRVEQNIREFKDRHLLWSLVCAFVAYVLASALPIPIAALASILCGWLFGWWIALPLVTLASTMGATLTFLYSRYFLRDWFSRRFGKIMVAVNQALKQDGPFYVLALRLVPGLPFFLVNATLGLTNIRLIVFFVLSQVGMLPGAFAFVYFGSQLPSLKFLREHGFGAAMSWQFQVALLLLVLLPWGLRLMVRRFRESSETDGF